MIDPISIVGLGLAVHTLSKLKIKKIEKPEDQPKSFSEGWFEGDEGWETVEEYQPKEENKLINPYANWSEPDEEGWSDLLD